jgi:2-methylcitrate dehydratase PrpD
MAAVLVARRVGLAELTDAFVQRPEVQAIFPLVSFTTTDATMPGSAFAPADSVEITTTSGATLKSGPIEYAKGSHQFPLSREELWTKFAECLGDDYAPARKSAAFENLAIFDRLNGAADLVLQKQ